MREVLPKIKTRGYWRVVLRPAGFVKERVADIDVLRDIVPKNAVTLRGWDFPHINTKEPVDVGGDWVGQSTDWYHHVELWRLYQSGQFVFYGCLWEDWQDNNVWGPPPDNFEIGKLLSIEGTIYSYTEIFEFAARLALSEAGAGADSFVCDVTLVGLQGRKLYGGNILTDWFGSQPAIISDYRLARTISASELVATPKELAVEFVSHLFKRFSWNHTPELLRNLQSKIGKF